VIAWHDLLFLEESYIKWAVYFMVLIRNCDRRTTRAICERLELAPRYRKIFLRDRAAADATLSRLERNLSNDNRSLYKQMSGLSIEMILYMMVCTHSRDVKRAISHFVTKLRYVTITVSGKDLMRYGLKPGPIYRDIMQLVLDAKLDGLLKTRDDELEFVKNHLNN
jgi:tRNA nucleotidyltransferase (CCA-adding enzyme)